MFDVSFSEIFVILLLTLLVFGPERLPEMASKIGKIMGQLRTQSNALRREFYNTVYTPAEEIKGDLSISNRTLRAFKDEIVHDFKDITSLDSPTTTPQKLPESQQEATSEASPKDDGSNKTE